MYSRFGRLLIFSAPVSSSHGTEKATAPSPIREPRSSRSPRYFKVTFPPRLNPIRASFVYAFEAKWRLPSPGPWYHRCDTGEGSCWVPHCSPEVHGDCIPIISVEGPHHAQHVGARGIPFQSVQQR